MDLFLIPALATGLLDTHVAISDMTILLSLIAYICYLSFSTSSHKSRQEIYTYSISELHQIKFLLHDVYQV